MTNDWDNDESLDEDWTDDGDEPADEETTACPECGGPVPSISDCCPACGYWITDVDRMAASKPMWLRFTVAVLLIVFLFSLLVAGTVFF